MSFSRHHMAFAALMHDIGKFRQRAGAEEPTQTLYTSKCRLSSVGKYLTYKHAMWTAEFLYRYQLPITDWDSIAEVAGCHHNAEVFNQPNYEKYLHFLREADHVASSWDRDQPEDEIGKYRANKILLHSVFELLSNDPDNPRRRSERKMGYPLQPLSRAAVSPITPTEGDFSYDYKALWEQFEDEYQKNHLRYLDIARRFPQSFEQDYFPQYIIAVQALLEKYTWCIPANTTEKKPASSLYHHSRNVALIANALYAADGCEDQAQSGEKRFMLVGCDLNGIQSYLYDLNQENQSKAGKLLRSRSAQIRILLELLARRTLDTLGLGSQSMLINVSGKWIILAPNSAELKSRLQSLRTEIEQEMFERYLGTLSINIAWDTTIGLADLDKYNFMNTIQKCLRDLEARKHHKFSNHLIKNGAWDPDAFVVNRNAVYANNMCGYCARRPKEHESDDSCPACSAEIDLGQKLAAKESGVFKIFVRQGAKALVQSGDYGFAICHESEVLEPKPRTDYFLISPDAGLSGFPLPCIPLAASVPMDKHGVVLDFESIAQEAEGESALAVVKGDVDDLGLLFRVGLLHSNDIGSKGDAPKPVCSISDYTEFSYMMDYFFSVYMAGLIKENYARSIYTVYSGGDDFCLVGAWDKLIEFMDLLRDKFRDFTAANPDIHFSAAISLMHRKAPVKFVIEETAEHLNDVKEAYRNEGKQHLHLFETQIPMAELSQQIKIGKNMLSLLLSEDPASKGVTAQFLYRLLGYHGMYIRSRESETISHDNLYDALLHYDIRRNLAQTNKDGNTTNPEVVKVFQEYQNFSGSDNMDYLRIPVCYALYKNRKKNSDDKNKTNND